MTDIKYAMWNCSGVLPTESTEKKIHFLETIISSTFDVLILTETHHKDPDEITALLKRYRNTHHLIHTEATKEDPYAGIIIFITKDFDIIEINDMVPGRLVNVQIKHKTTGKKYNLSSFYGHSNQQKAKKAIKISVEKLYTKHKGDQENIILGDFNFADNDLDRTNENRQGMNQTDKAITPYWNEFLDKIGMTDPFREKNKQRRMYSYIHTQRKARSRIDRVYVMLTYILLFHFKHMHSAWLGV